MSYINFFIVSVIAIILVILSSFIIPPAVSWVLLPYTLGSWLIFTGYLRRKIVEPSRVLPTPAYMVGWGGVLITIATAYLTQYYTGDLRITISLALAIILITVLLVNHLLNIRKGS